MTFILVNTDSCAARELTFDEVERLGYDGTLRNLPRTYRVRIPGAAWAEVVIDDPDMSGGQHVVHRLYFTPYASDAGYRGPAAEVAIHDIDSEGWARDIDVDSVDGPFWRAVQEALAVSNCINWEE